MQPLVEKVSKWGKVGKVFAVLSTLVLLSGAIAYTWTGLPSGAANYPRFKKAALDAGLFFTEAKVLELNKVPEAENAASILQKIEVPKIENRYELTLELLNDKWKDIEPGLRQLEIASRKKYLVSHWKFDGQQMAYYESPKALNRADSWSSLLYDVEKPLLETPNDPRLLRCLNVATYIATVAAGDHTYNGVVVRASATGRVEYVVRKLIPKCSKYPELLPFIDQILHRLDMPYDLANMLRVENFRGATEVDNIMKPNKGEKGLENDDVGGIMELRHGPSLPRFREANLARIHEYFSSVAVKLPKDPFDMEGMKLAFDSGNPVIEREDWSAAVLTRGMNPPYGLPRRIQAEQANRNTLMQAVAILKAHADPAKGLLLGGRYRWDRDGHSIRITKQSKGWVVYSIGNNRTDEGGLDATGTSSARDYVAHLTMATVPPEPPKAIQPKKAPKAPAGPYVPAYGSGD